MGWIGVDLDGTLAEYHGWPPDGSIGAPIPAMIERVKQWLDEGKDVRIFTARVWPLGTHDEAEILEGDPAADGLGRSPAITIRRTERAMQACVQLHQIQRWCRENLGCELPVTCVKDYAMIELWDDRAVQIIPNTGQPIQSSAT